MAQLRLDIYTDGSHKREKNYLAIGVYCKHQLVEGRLATQCSKELLTTYGINDTCCSNPTAEYVAFAEALKLLLTIKLPANTIINFYIDYIGVKRWTNGEWKAKKSYIQKIKTICLERIKQLGCTVSIHHIPGHSGIYGNEQADKLAGCEKEINTFNQLLSTL